MENSEIVNSINQNLLAAFTRYRTRLYLIKYVDYYIQMVFIQTYQRFSCHKNLTGRSRNRFSFIPGKSTKNTFVG